MGKARIATFWNITGNTFLFIIKLITGLMFNSIVLISDAIHSFTDVISSVAIFIAVKLGAKGKDWDHPFGHHRFEPMAGLIVAIMSGILAFEIVKEAIMRIITPQTAILSFIPIIILVIALITKAAMAFYFTRIAKKTGSPAIKATAIDCRNDILVTVVALLGFGSNFLSIGLIEPIAAILIGLWVLKQGYSIGKENINFLVGRCPPNEVIEKIEKKVLSIKEIKGIKKIRAHYVGNHVHVEIRALIDKKTPLQKAHDIEVLVENKVKEIDFISEAFIHLHPR